MIYFAELKGRRVTTPNKVVVGKISDLLFLAQDRPLITKIVVRTHEKELIIPLTDIVGMNGTVEIISSYTASLHADNELYVGKNLLDQQIIDIKGNKIVRVNDVVIQDKPQMMIAGVDIGLLGILRWFHIEQAFNKILGRFGTNITSQFLSWSDIQPLELTRGKVILKEEEEKLLRIAPEDLADHLEKMNIKNITHILDLLDKRYRAEVVESLNISYQKSLFRHFAPERAVQIMELIDPDEAVDILLSLSEKRRGLIVEALSEDKKKEIFYLLKLSKTPIGKLITSEFITAFPEDTVQRIRTTIKEHTQNFSFLNYVYIVNKQNQLMGVVNLHEIFLQNADQPMYKFMTPNVAVLHLTTPEEIAIRKMLKYKIEALPVIDDNKTILGIVTFDDLEERMLKTLR